MKKRNKTVGDTIKDILPALVIIFVTASAFTAAYFQNTNVEKATSLRQDADYHQQVSNELKNTFLKLNNEEFRILNIADSYMVEAENLLLEYLNIVSIITDEEAQSLLDRISYNYWQMEVNLELTTSYLIYEYFEIELAEAPYILDLYLDLDYSVEITKGSYFANDPQIEIITADNYLTDSLIGRGMIYEEEEYIIQDLVDNYYLPYNFIEIKQTWVDILFESIGIEIDLAVEFEIDATKAEQIASSIGIGVSITTVASILAAAMSNRLQIKRIESYFSEVRAEFANDESLIIKGKGKLAIVSLIVAAIIAVIGLLGPLLLGL